MFVRKRKATLRMKGEAEIEKGPVDHFPAERTDEGALRRGDRERISAPGNTVKKEVTTSTASGVPQWVPHFLRLYSIMLFHIFVVT